MTRPAAPQKRPRRLLRRAALVLLLVGLAACVGWEEREVVDAHDGAVLVQRRGLAAPWTPCGVEAAASSRMVRFKVHQWYAFGAVQFEAWGETAG